MKGFKNAKVYTEDYGVVKTSLGFDKEINFISENGVIDEIIELPENAIVLPGFIDQHIHGSGTADAMDGTVEALATIADSIACEGTTAFLATTMTQSVENITKSMIAVNDYKKFLSSGSSDNPVELLKIAKVDLLDKKTYEISGGEKQRVAICRALINEPDLILADEPTGNLDSKSGEVVVHAMEKISRELGKTIVMVTHDAKMASYCDRLILLKDGEILEELESGNDQEVFYKDIVKKIDLL